MMSYLPVGVLELAIFVTATIAVVLIRPARPWALEIVTGLLLAMLITPADPFSMLLAAAPLCAGYIMIRRFVMARTAKT